jgi:hypothetical protein
MFDTVRLLAENIVLEKEKLLCLHKTEITTYLDRDTGEVTDVFKITDNDIPFIKYNSTHHHLEFEVSIPKLLFGNNIEMTRKEDIDTFFNTITRQLNNLLGCSIDKSEWVCKRVDVCWNFQVGGQVDDYIKQLSLIKFPYRDTITYNHSESVIWQNGSTRSTLYNKKKEVKKKGNTLLLEKAKGILRFETSPSYYEMRDFSPRRLAGELLTKEFFIYITRKFSSQLADVICKEDISMSSLDHQDISITDIEKALGFLSLKELAGCRLKELYSDSTFGKRKRLLTGLQLEKVKLQPLFFDYETI